MDAADRARSLVVKGCHIIPVVTPECPWHRRRRPRPSSQGRANNLAPHSHELAKSGCAGGTASIEEYSR